MFVRHPRCERTCGPVWEQEARVTGADATAGNEFGRSVAVSGSTALIGAPGEHSATGAVFVFHRCQEQERRYICHRREWVSVDRFTSPEVRKDHRFGASVAVSGHLGLDRARRHAG